MDLSSFVGICLSQVLERHSFVHKTSVCWKYPLFSSYFTDILLETIFYKKKEDLTSFDIKYILENIEQSASSA